MESPFFVAAQVYTIAYFLSAVVLIPLEFEMEMVLVKLVACYYAQDWDHFLVQESTDGFACVYVMYFEDRMSLMRMFPKQLRVPYDRKYRVIYTLLLF